VSFTTAEGLRQRSQPWVLSPAGLMSTFCCHGDRDSLNLEGQVLAFISPGGRVALTPPRR
jgi:hypothetical protein